MTHSDSLSKTQPTRTVSWAPPPPPNRRLWGCFATVLLIPLLIVGCVAGVIFFGGGRTNILVLGVDSREPGSDLGRSDTMILTTFVPRDSYLGMLSIPRDLWVAIPNYGENRINAAHFFAEADLPGSGPGAAMQTVDENFDVGVDYYVRIRFDGFLDLVDLIGGVDVELPIAMSGYPAGTHHFDSLDALAFVRDRSGSDDFYRMERAQIFLTALWKRMLDPTVMRQLPEIIPVLLELVDTNIPIYKWPYLAFTLLRVGPEGTNAAAITREMTNPFTTSGGAQVLGPNWEAINPVLLEIFGE